MSGWKLELRSRGGTIPTSPRGRRNPLTMPLPKLGGGRRLVLCGRGAASTPFAVIAKKSSLGWINHATCCTLGRN